MAHAIFSKAGPYLINPDETKIPKVIPNFYSNKKMKKTGLAGIFAASLELAKEGVVKVSQNKMFDKLMIKKN